MDDPASVTLLGSLAVRATPADGALGGRRAELALAYLAVEHHRPVTRDELAEALWPNGLPASWMSALRAVLTQVRRFLRSEGLEDALVTGRSTYRLVLPDDGETDVDRVLYSTSLAERLADAGDHAAALRAARSARIQAGLPFLPHEEGEWIDGVRRSLRRSLSRLLTVEASASVALGERRAAIDAADRLVEVQPIDEAAHRFRIGLLARNGDPAGAARAYEDCRRALADVGLEPSPETASARWAPAAVTVANDAPSTSDAVTDPVPAPSEGLHRIGVLVVEDHDFQRRTLVQVLEAIGVGWAEGVADGHAGLARLAAASPPDLVVCDIDMPGMDGVEFVRNLGAAGGRPAVAFTSALEPAVLRSVEALSAGYGLEVLGVLPKPVTSRRLRELLSGFTPRARTHQDDPESRPALPGDLRRALGSGDLSAEVQPRLDLSTGDLAAIVVSPTWRRDRDVPRQLIEEQAGADGLAEELCGDLLRRAARLLTGRVQVPAVIIHPPPVLLTDLALADRWLERTRRLGLDPTQVVVEVHLRDHPTRPEVLDVLTRLRLKGFGVGLSGFDASPAALTCGEHLPLGSVTLAAPLVTGAAGDPERSARLEGVIDGAARLGLPVVADGCDHQEDYVLALAVGCIMAQGAHVGAPMPVGALAPWLVSRHAPAGSPP